MKLRWKKGIILASLVILLLPSLPEKTYAGNSIPFYNGGVTLTSSRIPGGPTFGRVDKTIGVNPLLGEMRYPTIYDGRIGGSSKAGINNTFTEAWMGSIQAYQGQPYYHLVPLPSKDTARNVIETYKVSSGIVRNVYNGNPDYVLSVLPKHQIKNDNTGRKLGEYYYIRELANYSGGWADNRGSDFDGINKTRLVFVRTSWPDIQQFNVNGAIKINQPLAFGFNGYEYVSENRNDVSWKITIKKSGSVVKTLSGRTHSNKSQKNPSKRNEDQAGRFNVASAGGWTPTQEGSYTAELHIDDAVQRYADKTISFNVNKDGSVSPPPTTTDPTNPEEPDPEPVQPPTIIGGTCPATGNVPERYEHELDVQVTRIDARTVDIDTETETDVYLKRDSFASSRNSAKGEFQTFISQTESLQSDCQNLISTWESEISKMQSDKDTCTSEKRPNCSVFDDAVSQYQSQISEGNSMMGQYQQKISEARSELNYINSNESKYSVVTPSVQLKHDGFVLGNISVSLSEGQTVRQTFPKWKVKSQGKNIVAQINSEGPYQEFRYSNLLGRSRQSLGYNTSLGHVLYPNAASNNWKDTKQYVATHETATCPKPTKDSFFNEQKVSGVVRTINDNGNKREIKEELITKFSKLPRDKMRAGYGFDYEITTDYRNYDTEHKPSNATGTKKVESYFPSMVEHLPYEKGGAKPAFTLKGESIPALGVDEGYQVPLQTNNPAIPRVEKRAWILPPVAIEEYSGNVFAMNNKDHLLHPERNEHDKLITTDKNGNSLHKWYVPFTEKDGDYIFSSRTYDAGVNHLNTCHIGEVVVDGVIIGDPNGNDDYVKRSITPKNPFPAGIGWNWTDKGDQLTNLSDWYLNWYADPKTVPYDQYKATFYLTPEKMEQIRKFNKENPDIVLGKSVFQSVDIPKVKKGG